MLRDCRPFRLDPNEAYKQIYFSSRFKCLPNLQFSAITSELFCLFSICSRSEICIFERHIVYAVRVTIIPAIVVFTTNCSLETFLKPGFSPNCNTEGHVFHEKFEIQLTESRLIKKHNTSNTRKWTVRS